MMEKTGVAELPLHPGHAPKWLFKRMVKLSGEIIKIIELEFGTKEVLKRLGDPYWFQAFSCVIGFDWHSSGTTTVTMGALKEALKPEDGIVVVGGKGKVSRNTPREIEEMGEYFNLSSWKIEELKKISRLAAKVDNAALQDGYQLYHHTMVIDERGRWTVIQQGLNEERRYARRYHWIYGTKSLVNKPHSGIISDSIESRVLNMVSERSEDARKVSVDIVNEGVLRIKNMLIELKDLKDLSQSTLDDFTGIKRLRMPWRINWKALFKAYEIQPKNYEEFMDIPGIGPSTVRALAYISEIIYGASPSWKDPVKYSFALGGKDGVPKPVNKKAYDGSIEILQLSIEEAKLGRKEKLHMLQRLRRFVPP